MLELLLTRLTRGVSSCAWNSPLLLLEMLPGLRNCMTCVVRALLTDVLDLWFPTRPLLPITVHSMLNTVLPT